MDKHESDRCEADAILSALADTAEWIAAAFGANCEVLVHDYRTPESSVVTVAGQITGRRAGDPMSEIGWRVFDAGDDAEAEINYRNRTPDGRPLQSSSIPIRDSHGHVIGCLCINVDTSGLQRLRDQLDDFLGGPTEQTVPMTEFPSNFNTALDEILLFEERSRGKELNALTKGERGEVLERINDRGLLEARGAVRRIAARLGVSRASIYQDLKEDHGSK